MKIIYDKEKAEVNIKNDEATQRTWSIWIPFCLTIIFMLATIGTVVWNFIPIWIPLFGASISGLVCWAMVATNEYEITFEKRYYDVMTFRNVIDVCYKSDTSMPSTSESVPIYAVCSSASGVVETLLIGCVPCKEHTNINAVTLNVHDGILYIPYKTRCNSLMH